MQVESTEEIVKVLFDTPLDFRGVSNPANYRLISSPGAVPIAVLSVDFIFDVAERGVGTIVESPEAVPEDTSVPFIANSSLGANLQVEGEQPFIANSSMTADLKLSAVLDAGIVADSGLTPELRIGSGRGGGHVIDVSGSAPGTGSATGIAVHIDTTPDNLVVSKHFFPSTGAFQVNQYISLRSQWNYFDFAQIVSIEGSGNLRLDHNMYGLDPQNGAIPWERTPGVVSVHLTVNKPTNGKEYTLEVRGLRDPAGTGFEDTETFTAVVASPVVVSAELLDDGQMVVTYSDPMRRDVALTDPGEYSITGPSTVTVQRVKSISDTEVLLETIGLGVGAYSLEVNATGTPHDVAGNPIDPVFNLAAFTGNIPVTTRSIFVDKGPITKPPLSLETGTTASIVDAVTIELPTATLGPSALGLYITLTGSALNNGTFRITAVVTATQVRVIASFTVPDPADGAISWDVFDPRDGVIADDPGDVTVLVNGGPVTPQAVVGLLGQIVLETPPTSTDTVAVDYCFVCNPTIEFRRMNSKEFRFNNWNRDAGRAVGRSNHKYRYNNSMVVPSTFESLDTLAELDQPQQRDLKYRAYERAYTATLNDPNLLLFNSPTHRIAFPPLKRNVESVFVNYQALQLPEDDPVDPWERVGTGSVSIVASELVIEDSSTGSFPTGQPIYYARADDLTFSHVFAAAWRMTLISSPITEGVWTGVAAGYADDERAYILGYLDVGGDQATIVDATTLDLPTAALVVSDEGSFIQVTDSSGNDGSFQITEVLSPTQVTVDATFTFPDPASGSITWSIKRFGFLKAGFGNDPSVSGAWTGGIDINNSATGLAADFDWSTIHSVRLLRDQNGIIRLYVDGSIVEILRIQDTEAPRLSELNAPFDNLQNIFFGSLSRPATNTSTWSFVRYVVQALNPLEAAPSVFVAYEGTTPPDEASQPWTPVGSHGTETIVSNDFLILDSTSASDPGTQAAAGLVGGDFRGSFRIEPLLSVSSDVVLDVDVSVRTFTHGINPNALMACIDDGTLLTQLSFLSDTEAPKLSYGGRSLPEDFSPFVWSRSGGESASMVGQLLRINDTSVSAGLVYFINDAPLTTSPDRVAGALSDYIMEFRVRVLSHTADGADYAGVQAQVYDSSRSVGLMFEDVAGVKFVTFHSDGLALIGGQFAFDWDDDKPHTYRFSKSTSGNLVCLFIDTVLIGDIFYSDFTVPASSPTGQISFGPTTSASVGSLSEVDWYYANCWRVLDSFQTFVGIWKGKDSDSLTGYHLPTKATGRNAAVTPNVAGSLVEDASANFLADGVVVEDYFVVDEGPNKGVYSIDTVATGSITTVSGADLLDGETFTLNDGTNTPTVFEFDLNGGGAAGVPVVFAATDTADDVRDAMIAAINAVIGPLVITAAPGGAGTVSLTNDVVGTQGNQTILFAVANGGFTVSGMAQSGTITATTLRVFPPFPVEPSEVDYRIPVQTDWTMPHKYRLLRDPAGGIGLFFDAEVEPLIFFGYNTLNLPSSSVGIPRILADGFPAIAWGAYDAENLSQSSWDFVRFGITRPQSELGIVPHHQVLNQRNIMASYEHHRTLIAHDHTSFSSESEGIPPQTEPDFLKDPGLTAHTLLNEGTPLVPKTQSYEVRRPTPTLVPVSAFNDPMDLLNTQSFVLNEAGQTVKLLVPDDVLYDCLKVIETTTGELDLIAPFDDDCQPDFGTLHFQDTVCLEYDGSVLPEKFPSEEESDWELESEDPSHVSTTAFAGILTYSTDGTGTKTIYRNPSPLPDSISMETEVKFKLRLQLDSSGGLGDSHVRFGFSSLGLTMALAFVTTPLGERYVLVVDLNNGATVGGIPFDFYDGLYHEYRMVRDPKTASVQIFIDS